MLFLKRESPPPQLIHFFFGFGLKKELFQQALIIIVISQQTTAEKYTMILMHFRLAKLIVSTLYNAELKTEARESAF